MNPSIDLEYLVNPILYDKILKKETSKITRDDIKFYRKRLIQQTRDLLKPSLAKSYPPSLQHIFNEYIVSAIVHLKQIDQRDILQEEYNSFNKQTKKVQFKMEDNYKSPEQPDELLYNKPEKNIRNFVTVTRPKKDKYIPTQKKVDLREPKLRMKGIKKKISTDNNGNAAKKNTTEK
tara:strand:- start:3694 stop:4224 length:531 start_codon:yes stop_codon:yes gene_type:complete